MDVCAAVVGISGRKLHGLRLQKCVTGSRYNWLRRLHSQRQSDRGHCPGRLELQVQLGKSAVLTRSLPQRESKRPRAHLGVFLLKRDEVFGETAPGFLHENRCRRVSAIGT